MARHHATPEGNVPFTDAEETARDAEEKAWADGSATRAWADLRQQRDQKLAATDWTASTDVTMTAEMTTYRQALRDVPQQEGFPNEIDWPVEPT